jgi:hypothetical protein
LSLSSITCWYDTIEGNWKRLNRNELEGFSPLGGNSRRQKNEFFRMKLCITLSDPIPYL